MTEILMNLTLSLNTISLFEVADQDEVMRGLSLFAQRVK